jgi:hypothetical protein
MYEMEGPRAAPLPRRRLLGSHVLRGHLTALASRLLRCRVRRGSTGVGFPPSGPVSRSVLCVPSVSLGADPVFSGDRFLLPIESAAQGLSVRTSRFFSHPQDICCLSSVHG